MHFDDRLQTLLAAPVADPRDRAVRWRQLVDLLARGGPASSAIAGEALELVRREAFAIDEEVRAATLRAIAGRPLPSALLQILAAQPVRIAAPVFAGLSLSHAEAAHILTGADAELRALVRIETEAAPAAEPPPAPAEPSISEMIGRIERLQQQRAPAHPAVPTPPSHRHRPPSTDGEGRLFEWESDASGHVAWVEGAPRGALVGRPLGGDGVGLLDREVAPRLAARHPFVDVPVALGDLLAGAWRATGVPAFDPSTGRFLGYRGLARRTDGAAPPSAEEREPDLNALREMVHEIKTPLNAIIGFAEIIDGQYFGPAHRRYRERAADIVTNARMLLEAANDLDFVARAQSAGAGASGTGFAELLPRLADRLAQDAARLGVTVALDAPERDLRCALDPALTERLLGRFTDAVLGAASPGEHLVLRIRSEGGRCAVAMTRPRATVLAARQDLLDPEFTIGQADRAVLGLGFSLRLVNGLAELAGGAFDIDDERFTLFIPGGR